jgi:glutamate racemase
MSMKKIIVCDSGLGGLNIASRFFAEENKALEACELIYFNAYPAPDCGFNKLPSCRAQEEVFRDVLEGMKKFSPDLCLIACNTLSIVYERLAKWYTPEFPVVGIVDVAVDALFRALNENPGSQLLILGTKSTVESGVYAQRVAEKGIDPARIKALGCPGLATLLESDPAAPEVSERIRNYASDAAKMFDGKVEKLFLGLCCTHFGFAADIWLRRFGEFFPCVQLVDPNVLLGNEWSAQSIRYVSRIDFFPGAMESMCACFEKEAPLLAGALKKARSDKELFKFSEGNF